MPCVPWAFTKFHQEQQKDLNTVFVLQLDVSLWEQDWRWHCERNFKLSLGDGKVDLFFVDTNPGIVEYQTAVFANHKGGLLWRVCMMEALPMNAECCEEVAAMSNGTLLFLLLLHLDGSACAQISRKDHMKWIKALCSN